MDAQADFWAFVGCKLEGMFSNFVAGIVNLKLLISRAILGLQCFVIAAFHWAGPFSFIWSIWQGSICRIWTAKSEISLHMHIISAFFLSIASHYSHFNIKPSWYTILSQMTLTGWRIVKPEIIIIIIYSIGRFFNHVIKAPTDYGNAQANLDFHCPYTIQILFTSWVSCILQM